MSKLYPEYFSTDFPDALDRWENMIDVTIETKPIVDQFYRYYNDGDFDSAARVIEENPILRRMMINADNMNKLLHGIMALERFFYEDVERYLMYIVKPQGDFDPGRKYTKYDVVFIARDDAKEAFMGIQTDIPVGTPPTDTRYFVPLALRGKQGASGMGLSPRGVWSSVISYYKDDCVSYGNIIWQCNKDNTGVVPREDDNTYWEALLRVPQQVVTSTTMPEGQVYNDIWIHDHGDQTATLYRKNLDGTYGVINLRATSAAITFEDGTTLQEFQTHVHPAATRDKDGFFSASDKRKLDSLPTSVSYPNLSDRPPIIRSKECWNDAVLQNGILQISPDGSDEFDDYQGYGLVIGRKRFLQPRSTGNGFIIIGHPLETAPPKAFNNVLEVGYILGYTESYLENCLCIGDETGVFGKFSGSIIAGGGGDMPHYGPSVYGDVSSSILVMAQIDTTSVYSPVPKNVTVKGCALFGTRHTLSGAKSCEYSLFSGNGNKYNNYGQTNENEKNITCSCAIGKNNQISGECSIALGENLTAKRGNIVVGRSNKELKPLDDVFTVGGGSYTNVFRVQSNGGVYGVRSYNASGADYAECFEWLDGNPDNEDRRGRFVTLDGERIRLAASEDDYIVGIVSATPSVVGDNFSDDWKGKYVRDIFGAVVPDGKEAFRLSPDFNPEIDNDYVSRLDRPEWDAVGMMGKLIAVDDGTCVVNGYCKPSDGGIATASETGYRVLRRIDYTHIKILLK